ncbi:MULTISPECIES: GTP cyclohydrolase II [Bacillus cereus group]|uniref:GTP cyclohydrolase II n=1 Tax=Bacillus cereus group TaxID=86661 RepID=UPI001F5A24FA|nr:GTP cyclohydrolase II [Bacillus pacificus]MED0823862.1 GTP cyclohydrolase II [Bacillus pacificus]
MNVIQVSKSDKYLQHLEKSLNILPTSNGKYLYLFGPTLFPTYKDSTRHVYNWYVWKVSENHLNAREFINNIYQEEYINENYNSILTYGNFCSSEDPLVRVHSCCFTGDIFKSSRCDCGPQLEIAIEKITHSGSGAIVYMSNHEGRGIGLLAKAMTNQLQDLGLDTYTSNRVLGFKDDVRDFSEAAQVINYLRNYNSVKLLTNNPDKMKQLSENGLKISAIEKIEGFSNSDNFKYLEAKKAFGHMFK